MILWVIEVDKVLVIVGLHLMLYTVLFLIRRSLHRGIRNSPDKITPLLATIFAFYCQV